jgi:hypothetical protein
MFNPNPVEFELPYQEGLLLQLRGEWIAERKMRGIRAILESGILKSSQADFSLPGLLPEGWESHVFDGCLVGSIYYVFDVLSLDGEDTRGRPLFERRTLLRSLRLPEWCRLAPCGKNLGEFLEAVVRDGGEGIILKNLLERYGRAQWIKVERPMVREVVIMAIDDATLSVQVGQFDRGMMADRGTVFLGYLVAQAKVGQVIEVDLRCSAGRPRAAQPRFVRFRADCISLGVHASGEVTPTAPGKFIRLQPQDTSSHSTAPIGCVI